MTTNKEEIIKRINELEVERLKLFGAFELLEAQDKEKETKPAE